MNKTVKCPHCSKLYKYYAFTVADQSACPSCVAEAERNMKNGRNDKYFEQFKS